MPKKTFHLITLGCAKNTVDSDSMTQLLVRDGYRLVNHPSKAGVLIVNTCGFINQAREENYAVLRELAESKAPGQVLIAAGCLTQRYGEEVARRVPGIDGILGTRRWMDIVEVVQKLRQSTHPVPVYHLPAVPSMGTDEHGTLRAAVAGSSAYLKIADGCRRPCAFCAIPLIKGTLVSRPLETILSEAHILVNSGVRELILIAQDTTDYGYDLGIKDGLPLLLDHLTSELPPSTVEKTGLDWIRIMYAFPGAVSDQLIDVMVSHPQVLPYLDIPLQHAHPDILRSMQRPSNMDWVYNTISKMRKTLPALAIRTTCLVGYPGETEAEFQTLYEFIQEMRFDRAGAFQFSYETGTPSTPLGDPIPTAVKENRYNRLMELQQGISLQINQSFVGKTLDVLIEGRDENISIGRSYRDAPEIDGLVLVEGQADIGNIVPVWITGAMTYDLIGVLVDKLSSGLHFIQH
jgi:ribosomal protein S12 methylthiotransferase